MKKRTTVTAISLFICLCSLLSSCSYLKADKGDGAVTSGIESEFSKKNEEKIKELEAKIVTLLQNQQISESERKKEISSLKAEIASLKKSGEEATESEKETEPPSVFKYTLSGYKATITSIDADEESILIPSVIDGHAVSAIGSDALSSSKVKHIALAEGVESLDWFAFRGCSSLSSIAIPKTVTSIGYGAFDGAPKSLTIECEKDSFAMKYAQSYGLKYVVK